MTPASRDLNRGTGHTKGLEEARKEVQWSRCAGAGLPSTTSTSLELKSFPRSKGHPGERCVPGLPSSGPST